MKKILINLISIYQLIINGVLKNVIGVNKFCRFEVSCSEYAKQKINEKGALRGLGFALIRVLRCHPFTKTV